MVQANPQILQVLIAFSLIYIKDLCSCRSLLLLSDYCWRIHTILYFQPLLQELGKQNPHLMRLIQEHQTDFLRLINEPAEGEG